MIVQLITFNRKNEIKWAFWIPHIPFAFEFEWERPNGYSETVTKSPFGHSGKKSVKWTNGESVTELPFGYFFCCLFLFIFGQNFAKSDETVTELPFGCSHSNWNVNGFWGILKLQLSASPATIKGRRLRRKLVLNKRYPKTTNVCS